MTVVAVLADPPRPGLVLPELAASSPLTEAEAADLYAAMVKDAAVAVERSGGDLLVNYRAEDDLEEFAGEGEADAEAEVRALVADALSDPDEARYEVQVGSTVSARAGNTVTHLLREEGVQSAAVVRGNAPFVTRQGVDSAAMKLRSSEVVLGPSTDGRVYYAGFTDPPDFEDALGDDELPRLARRADDAGLETDFLPVQPVVERGADLLSLVPILEARIEAERIVPEHTATLVRDLGLRVEGSGSDRHLVRD